MNNFQIECFLSIAKYMSFSKAADAMFIAQSSISRHIIQLETELGSQLFVRSGKSIGMTKAGEEYYCLFSEVKIALEDIKERHTIYQTDQQSHVRFSVFPVWNISDILLNNAKLIEQNNPNLKTSLVFHKMEHFIQSLSNGKVDISFHLGYAANESGDISQVKLLDIPHIVLFSSQHPLLSQKVLTPINFKNETFLYVVNSTMTPNVVHRQFELLKEKYGFTPKTAEVPDIDTLLLMLESSQGIALMDYWSRSRLNSRLRYITTDLKAPVVLAWNQSNHNPGIQVFVSETKKYFKTMIE